ncbi:MAG: response regulator transcription factor, partial [Peptococcaceae bacterium]|nr:response regulator transcription factor [Peptococcaceae bacterium]
MIEILAIDDDAAILSLIRRALERDGYRVTTVTDARTLEAAELCHYELILLDVMMPGEDGFALCRRIRGMVDCPILFLTAKTAEADLLEGLSIGGDDYIKKPFSLSELRARVAAHLRRERREKTHSLHLGRIELILLEKKLLIDDEEVPLTKSEYAICELLALHKGQVFSKERILEAVFGYDGASNASAITEHVKNIRAKCQPYGLNP